MKQAPDYVMIIGRRDRERFRRFRTGQDAAAVKSIPETARAGGVWALLSTTDGELWGRISRGSRIFFAEHGSSFTRCGTVMGKLEDSSVPTRIWGDSPRMRGHGKVILFSSVREVEIPFHGMIRDAGLDALDDHTGLYMAERSIKHAAHGRLKTASVFLDDKSGAPYRKSGTASRFDRDRKKVERLKSIYRGKCQICGYALEIPPDMVYSEVHHVHPLGDGGDDSLGNMIVVCPTHHKEMDYKAIGIGIDGTSVVDRKGRKIGSITVKPPHRLARKNIAYHLREMRKDGD